MTDVPLKYSKNVDWVYVKDSRQSKPVYRVDTLRPSGSRMVWIVGGDLMYSNQTEWVYWSHPGNPDAKPVCVMGSDLESGYSKEEADDSTFHYYGP